MLVRAGVGLPAGSQAENLEETDRAPKGCRKNNNSQWIVYLSYSSLLIRVLRNGSVALCSSKYGSRRARWSWPLSRGRFVIVPTGELRSVGTLTLCAPLLFPPRCPAHASAAQPSRHAGRIETSSRHLGGCHRHPTGASKWNPIEHRLFSEISKNWAAEPLDSYEKMLKFIRTTGTQTGLVVTAYLDRNEYPTRLKPDPQLLPSLRLTPGRVLPRWNYTIQPNL
jgi:hypothetical protein